MGSWISLANLRIAIATTLASLGVTIDAQQPRTPFCCPPAPPMPPDAEAAPFADAHFLARPSPSLRHAVAASFGDIPPQGISFSIRCAVTRASGRIPYCNSESATGPLGAGSYRLALAYRLDLAERFRRGQGLLTVTVRDEIARADIRDTGFLRRPLTDHSQILMTRLPSPAGMAAPFVPIGAVMRTTCEIQPDLSFFCVDPQPVGLEVDQGTLEFLQDAVFEVTSIMRAAPRLRNGQDARGVVVSVGLRFAR